MCKGKDNRMGSNRITGLMGAQAAILGDSRAPALNLVVMSYHPSLLVHNL